MQQLLTGQFQSGATLLSGQGTISIAVSYPSTIVAGNITAQASNNCGVSSMRCYQ
ncbi:MAG: hypothetical protein V9E88_09435 [Ferruginibacter sp.]